MSPPRIVLRHLFFSGPAKKSVGVRFVPGPNLVYGASNTGKSFILKSLDFMLGSQGDLPDIEELEGFDTLVMAFLVGNEALTLTRQVSGGKYNLFHGLHELEPKAEAVQQLSAKHDGTRDDNLSNFLLKRIGLGERSVVTSADGKKRSLSFRDLMRFVLINETDIQIEQSPVESGQHVTRTAERSVFRLVLSGSEDATAAVLVDAKTAAVSRTAHIELLDNMIEEVNRQIASEYPNAEGLSDQISRAEQTMSSIQLEFESARKPVLELLNEKRDLSKHIPELAARYEEIETHLARFALLESVFQSDLQRLQALEEASFLVAVGADKDCPVCGAPPDAQKHLHHLNDIQVTREAAIAEIQKIRGQQHDLQSTVSDLSVEQERLRIELDQKTEKLKRVEADIEGLSPRIDQWRISLGEIVEAREHALRGKALIDRRQELMRRRAEIEEIRRTPKADKPKLAVPGSRMHELCKVISEVLTAWEFPGDRVVSFDERQYDIRIDGKLRTDNGKGVRALTHAAFKIALLKYCREKDLPHPNFLVLDTPLLAYRDPMRKGKAEPLAEDEKALIQKPVKQRFFEYLRSIHELGQFIILENIDPPASIDRLAHVEVFYGPNNDGRRHGLFPPAPKPATST
jgi:peptidoglycan hydrolase CwlO-like protein